MGFLEFIEKVQKKPEPFRQKLALFSVAIITILIIFVWLSLSGFVLREKEAGKTASPDPFSVIKESVKEIRNIIRENVSI